MQESTPSRKMTSTLKNFARHTRKHTRPRTCTQIHEHAPTPKMSKLQTLLFSLVKLQQPVAGPGFGREGRANPEGGAIPTVNNNRHLWFLSLKESRAPGSAYGNKELFLTHAPLMGRFGCLRSAACCESARRSAHLSVLISLLLLSPNVNIF